MRFQPACLLLVLLLACLGCQETPPTATPVVVPTPTRWPIAIATPTATPVVAPMPTRWPIGTATPTIQSTDTSRNIAAIPTASPTPAVFYRTEHVETFHGPEGSIVVEADALFAQGKYFQAIPKYKEAQGLVSKPSHVIQNRIGLSYRYLRDNEQAIHHFSKAIEINDISAGRVNRASVYFFNGQCDEAMQDAQAALTMKPSTGVGFHTYAEAHFILGQCFILNEQYELALEQVDLALAIAKEYKFSDERVEQIDVTRAGIEGVAEGSVYPEDLLLGYASEDSNIGVAHFNEGRYREAITAFLSAQRLHGKPSSFILHMLARSYILTGDFESGIHYFSEAIEVRDDANNRVWRALHLWDCEKAVEDAYAALDRKPYVEPGYHTSVEAFFIVVDCQTLNGQFEGDLADFEDALKLAKESGYTPEEISLISELHQEALELRKEQETPTP